MPCVRHQVSRHRADEWGVFHSGFAAIEALFTGGLQANGTVFEDVATFSRSQFTNGAVFTGAQFAHLALFDRCVFDRGEPGKQSSAVHNGDTYFNRAKFGAVDFSHATFRARAVFDGADFSSRSSTKFSGARFLRGGSAEGTQFAGALPAAFRVLAHTQGAAKPRP